MYLNCCLFYVCINDYEIHGTSVLWNALYVTLYHFCFTARSLLMYPTAYGLRAIMADIFWNTSTFLKIAFHPFCSYFRSGTCNNHPVTNSQITKGEGVCYGVRVGEREKCRQQRALDQWHGMKAVVTKSIQQFRYCEPNQYILGELTHYSCTQRRPHSWIRF